MNNVFEPKRFGNYLLHDLKNAKDNYLYSFIITAGLPVLTFILVEILGMIFNKNHGFVEYPLAVQIVSVIAAVTSAMIVFPIKQYGQITDKRYGSSWVMLPASGFEKWLSLIIMTCVVLPVCLFTVYLGLDWLMSVVAPGLYPKSLASYETVNEIQNAFNGEDVSFNAMSLGWLSWVENILTFTLGAVFFKKSKFPKTLLCVMAFGIILSFIAMACIGTGHIGTDNVEELFKEFSNGDPETAVRRFKALVHIIACAYVAVLAGGIYVRITSIKH